ncbi:phage antirepressor [Paenibacillus filicis]|uniref:Phage antirepressor n=1 Tax=Paenibacillus filicis TaxID=669464 RepID=A0ABU9DTJ6_9BACL
MNLPQIFNYNGANVRTVLIKNEPWFVLKDVCDLLELASRAVRQRISDDVCSTYAIRDSVGRSQDTTIINEDGLYDVILESRKAEAKAFRKWVTSEVLPSIRKHGAYMTPETLADALSNPDGLIVVLTRLKHEQDERARERSARLEAEAKIEADRPKVIFAESLQVSDDSILIGELAKVLKQNGIDVGQNRLFKILREEGYLIKSGEQYNMPTQRSMDLRLMEIKTGSRSSSDGMIKITRTSKVTGKGQIYFINKFKGRMQAG